MSYNTRWALAIFVLFLASRPLLAETYDFESSSPTHGWTPLPNPAGPGTHLTDEFARSGQWSLRCEDGGWRLPGLQVGTREYYGMTAYVRGVGQATLGLLESVRSRPFDLKGDEWTRVAVGYRGTDYSKWGGSVPRHFTVETLDNGVAYVDDVSSTILTSDQMAAMLDDVYESMGGGDFAQYMQPDRHRHVKKTMEKLYSGQEATVVMLGDSIVNDTYTSMFETLVSREHPGTMNTIPAVRGSTGCWWYQDSDENGVPRVQSYVLDHQPDLVMIGGISHQSDTEAIREVIHQIGAQAEILLLTEIAGYTDPDTDSSVYDAVDSNGEGWRSELYRLAAEEEVGFLDMTQPWFSYIEASGHPLEHFKRDAIHNNFLGTQVAGRTLEAYFVPEPCTLAVVCMGAMVLGLNRRKTR